MKTCSCFLVSKKWHNKVLLGINNIVYGDCIDTLFLPPQMGFSGTMNSDLDFLSIRNIIILMFNM